MGFARGGAVLAIAALVACGTSHTDGGGGGPDGGSPPVDGGGTMGSPPVTKTIGAGGGTIASGDGRLTLEVPAGALAGDVALTITEAAGAPPGYLGKAYAIGPEGTTFSTPAQIRIAYDAPAPGTPVEIGHLVSGAWARQPGTVIATVDGVAAAPTTHLSMWAIIPAANEPCACHPADFQACCHGCFAYDGTACSCDDSGGAETFFACYTQRIGGERVPNFCTRCLHDCCTSKGGHSNAACDCETGTLAQALSVLSCAGGCFTQSNEPASVCLSPSSGQQFPPNVQCTGTLLGPPPLPTTGLKFQVSCTANSVNPVVASLSPGSTLVDATCTATANGACTAWQATWSEAVTACGAVAWQLEPLAGATGCSVTSAPSAGKGAGSVSVTFACPTDAQADSVLSLRAGIPFPL